MDDSDDEYYGEDDGQLSLAEALHQAEAVAAATHDCPDLDHALEIAMMQAAQPIVKEVWRGIDDSEEDDVSAPSRKIAALAMEDCDWERPHAVGHALVQACHLGLILVVRRLREIQRDSEYGSLMVALFNAFGLLSAAEAGHDVIVSELLRPMVSASTALMGFMVATKWKDSGYPFVAPPPNPPNATWSWKLASSKSNLPNARPVFRAWWELAAGTDENLDEVVRACYATYLVWRVSVIAATKCHTDVFRILLKKRFVDNLFLKETLRELNCDGAQVKRMLVDRAKIDSTLYQCVEEYSTKHYNDAMLYTLWKCCVSNQSGKDLGKPKCAAEAHDGIWEIKLEVPLLMMQVDHVHKDEEPKDRYKELTMVYPQTAQLSIQLERKILGHANFLQVEVKIKQVRLKVDNARWDESCMGHFPSGILVSVEPLSDEGSSVTLTNSSHNAAFTVGRAENFGATVGLAGAFGGVGTANGGNVGVSNNILMTSTPWRFEQVPLPDSDRGGSFKWTLQAMKGLPFDRANPARMASAASMFKWGRRVPSNPLDELPFTSEGGVQFTATEFSDAMLWRFSRDLESSPMRWRIQGEIHTTYTTCRYFETRSATFSGDIEDTLKAAKANFETTMKDFKDDVSEILGLSEAEQPYKAKEEKKKEPTLEKFNTVQRTLFMQWLQFQQALEQMNGGSGKPMTAFPGMMNMMMPAPVEEEKEKEVKEDVGVQLEEVPASATPSLLRLAAVKEEKEEVPVSATRPSLSRLVKADHEEEVPVCTTRPSLSRLGAAKIEKEDVGWQVVNADHEEEVPVSGTPSLSRVQGAKGKSWFARR